MNILAAVLTCSLHADDALVRAIVDNAHGNPYMLINPELDPEAAALAIPPRTPDAAITQLNDLLAQGVEPLVGVMQVPVAWAATFGRKPDDLFDPCINITVGSAMLSAYDYDCAHLKASVPLPKSTGAPHARRLCVLHRYAEAIRVPDLETVVTLDLRFQHAPLPSPADAPILAPALEPCRWGPASLLLPTTPGPAASPPPPEPATTKSR